MSNSKGPLRWPFFFRPPLLTFAALLVLLGAAWWALRPGLTGEFLFDDYANINALGAYGGVHDIKGILLYLTSGPADPTGRPVSLLTFLIDANTWPAEPAPFLLTNILLHLLNGFLLIGLLFLLGIELGIERSRAAWTSILGGGLWLLHPFLVSTTLYIVQREAMLPATFSLIGLICWTYGRRQYLRSRKPGTALLVFGAWGCTILATFSKANGALLPLLMVVAEFTILPQFQGANAPDARSFRKIRAILLGLPCLALTTWLALQIPHQAFTVIPLRGWSPWQRLITESRVLADYLKSLWLPQPALSGLFNDGYKASADLLHPWTTLPSILLCSGLIAAGIGLRKKHPPASFAILFFFGAHILESSFIPLELYFEHRNYLPSMPMFWPLALALTSPAASLKNFRFALSVGLLCMLAVMTHTRAEIWGHPYEQAELFAIASPDSARAQVNAATYERLSGQNQLAMQRLWDTALHFPTDAQAILSLIDTSCAQGGVPPAVINAAKRIISNSAFQAVFINKWLIRKMPEAASKACAGLNFDTLKALIQADSDNVHFHGGAGRKFDLYELSAYLALAENKPDLALTNFNEALSSGPSMDAALVQSAALGNAGFPQQALAHLDYFETLTVKQPAGFNMQALHHRLLVDYGYWEKDFRSMQQQLKQDIEDRRRLAQTHAG